MRRPPENDALRALLEGDEQEKSESRLQTLWRFRLQWIVGLAGTLTLAFLTYSREGWIPILSGADLGIHELGHLLFMWAPGLIVQFAGTFMQVAVPLAFCAYYTWRRDGLASVLTLSWAAESLNNSSHYIYDATRRVLPLFGDDRSGQGHDWANILATTGLLPYTDQLSLAVRLVSACLFAVAFGICAWRLAEPLLKRRATERYERVLAERRAMLPIREPANSRLVPEAGSPPEGATSAVQPGDGEL